MKIYLLNKKHFLLARDTYNVFSRNYPNYKGISKEELLNYIKRNILINLRNSNLIIYLNYNNLYLFTYSNDILEDSLSNNEFEDYKNKILKLSAFL